VEPAQNRAVEETYHQNSKDVQEMAKPVAGDDTASISADDADLTITGNLLANDVDPDGGVLLLRFVNGIRVGDKGVDTIVGTYGTFTFNKNGTFSYVLDPTNPAGAALQPGETLTEKLTYKISDGNGETDFGLFKLTIDGPAPNEEPKANLDTYSLGVSTDEISGNVLNNDTDPDGDALQVSFIGEGSPLTYIPDPGGPVSYEGQYGTITIGRDGAFTYDIDETNPTVAALGDGETLSEYFTYKIWDGQSTNSADQDHISIVINGDGI
jgi:VCBS repeat-containing protein